MREAGACSDSQSGVRKPCGLGVGAEPDVYLPELRSCRRGVYCPPKEKVKEVFICTGNVYLPLNIAAAVNTLQQLNKGDRLSAETTNVCSSPLSRQFGWLTS